MSKYLRVAAALASTAVLGVAASSASALSLGPAGTTISGQSTSSPNLNFGNTFRVRCQTTASGKLDGSATANIRVLFSNCVASSSTLSGAATVVASSDPAGPPIPGFLQLKLLSFTKATTAGGSDSGLADLTTGAFGYTAKIGNCTLSVSRNLTFTGPTLNSLQKMALSSQADAGGSGQLFGYGISHQNPYLGSDGCPAEQRGYHATGSGMEYWGTSLTGLALAP